MEALAGSDARVGAEVEIALRGFPERAYNQKNGMRGRGEPELDRLEWAAAWFGAGPTSSLDVAMKLVPERSWGHLEVYRPDHQTLGWTVYLMPNSNLSRDGFKGFAATYPLALTAAALRAHAQLKEEVDA